nr:MAG: FKBP-type peptidyl-prolyl cis-trans isomerases 2 [Candidatus Nanosalinarum sp. J07AB56]
MEKGELVLIHYTGKTDGEVFDTSREEVANENDLDTDQDFKPAPVLVGEQYVIEGLEEAVEQMEVGDSETVSVEPEKGYGERDSEDVDVYRESEFESQGIDNVRRGDELMIGNRRGRVLSNESGRVRIDFNHPLAGQELEYDVEVVEEVEDNEEKAEYIFSYRLGHGDISFEDGTATVTHDHDHEIPQHLKDTVRNEILEYTGLEDVEFEE